MSRCRPESDAPVIDAIISARDEAPTVAGVVTACLAAAVVREVIVVDDGSLDDTAFLAAAAGAKVVPSQSAGTIAQAVANPRPARTALLGMIRRATRGRRGDLGSGRQLRSWRSAPPAASGRPPGSKSAAMATGVSVSDAATFLFLDADLIGLTPAHLELLCQPVLDGTADMSVGWLDYGWWNPVLARLPPSTGERVLPRWVFEAVPPQRRDGYKMEILLNEVIAENHHRSAACILKGVRHRTKRDKLGPKQGRRETWRMFWTLAGMPMTGEVRWRTIWFYWRGLSVRRAEVRPASGPGGSRPRGMR